MAKQSDKAVYYNTNLVGAPMDVLKSNADGTVDIGTGDKVVVKSCPVSKEAKHGHVTLGSEPMVAVPEPVKQTAAQAATAQIAVATGK